MSSAFLQVCNSTETNFLPLALATKGVKYKWKLSISEGRIVDLNQGSQTRVPRAAYGPSDVFVRPATSLKLLKLLLKLRFFVVLGQF